MFVFFSTKDEKPEEQQQYIQKVFFYLSLLPMACFSAIQMHVPIWWCFTQHTDKLGRLLKQCICTKFSTVPCSVNKRGMITSLEFGKKHFFSKFIANRCNEKFKLRFSSYHRSLHQKMLRRDSWTHNTIIIIQCRLFLLDSTEIQFLRSCKRQSGMILAIIISFWHQ